MVKPLLAYFYIQFLIEQTRYSKLVGALQKFWQVDFFQTLDRARLTVISLCAKPSSSNQILLSRKGNVYPIMLLWFEIDLNHFQSDYGWRVRQPSPPSSAEHQERVHPSGERCSSLQQRSGKQKNWRIHKTKIFCSNMIGTCRSILISKVKGGLFYLSQTHYYCRRCHDGSCTETLVKQQCLFFSPLAQIHTHLLTESHVFYLFFQKS